MPNIIWLSFKNEKNPKKVTKSQKLPIWLWKVEVVTLRWIILDLDQRWPHWAWPLIKGDQELEFRCGVRPESAVFAGVRILNNNNQTRSTSEIFSFYRSWMLLLSNLNFLWHA